MLSTQSTMGCDMSWPISANRLRMISVAASDAAMISASVVEIEIDCCRLLLAWTTLQPMQWQVPVVLWATCQSASE